MLIGLHDADRRHGTLKSFPNLALMKISRYYKNQGHHVVWWEPYLNGTVDFVLSSKVFDFTPVNKYLPVNTYRGGTGYGCYHDLDYERENLFPDYSIYPHINYAVGFLTRGCIRQCSFCIVPKKEGNIRPDKTWQSIVRPDSNRLVLMDNNILACDHGIGQLQELASTHYRIDINQGLDARLVDEQIADILAKLKWKSYIRFSCDSDDQVEYIEKAFSLLKARGIKKSKIFIYLLVTKNIKSAEYRVQKLKTFKIYAQPEYTPAKNIENLIFEPNKENMPNKEQKNFARYCYANAYKTHSYKEFKRRGY